MRLQLGYIMFYVRTPAEGGQEAIAGALSILWLVVPNVQDIHFKDLKQTLRKEQCDVRSSYLGFFCNCSCLCCRVSQC